MGSEIDEWEYETCLPTTIPSTIPRKETPRTLPSYYERPSSADPKEIVETVHVVPVSESKAKGEYTWGEAQGCDDMKVDAPEGKREEGGQKVVKEESKEGRKDKSKGLKKSDVDEWRNSISDVTTSVEDLIIVEEEIPCKAHKIPLLKRDLMIVVPKEKKKRDKDKDRHHERKEYERKEWRRRPEKRK
jgi:hypothetical protein